MKLLFIINVFWATILIEGVPNNYEIILQPRGISDLPFLGWFYGSSTEDIHEKDAPHLPHQQTDQTNADKPELIKKDNKDQLTIEPDLVDETGLDQETNELDKWNSKDMNYHVADDKIKVIPVDEIGPNEKPEPIENLLQNLKQEVNETSNEEKKNIATLLTDLNKTMKETSTNLAKVFINNTWRIFDIGALGTTRRTRNLDESISLLAPLYALLGLFSQLLGGMNIAGNNLLLGNSLGGNNAQAGLLQLLFPFLSNSQNGINQKVLGGIAGLPGGANHDTSNKKVVVICIDDEHKKEANRLIHGKTPDAILSRIKEFLDKNSLTEEEQFFIILRLHDLYDHLSKNNDETTLKLLKAIILIGEDPRFQKLFNRIKLKTEPEFTKIWKSFKHKPKFNDKYLTILRNLPQRKIAKFKTHPSRDCFIIGPNNQKSESDEDSDLSGSGSDSDDEDTHSKLKKQAILDTYLKKISARGSNSKEDLYICCLDDDDELKKAKQILDGKTNDETIDNIKKKIETHNLSPEFKWYIILRLYNMLKDIEKNDKKYNKDGKDKAEKDIDNKDKKDKEDKDKKDQEDKEKIIKLIVVIGENPKFEPFIKEIKSKDNPSFSEIWKLLKNQPRETKVEDKPPEKENNDQKDPKEVPKHSSDSVATPPKEEKVIKEEIAPKKEVEVVPEVESAPPPQNQMPQWIKEKSLPEILALDHSIWERDYDHILRYVETKMKDPELNEDSRWNVVDIIDRWYLGKFVDEPLFGNVKSKANELVKLVKEDPKYDETFKKIDQRNPYHVTNRVFKLFGKEMKKPEPSYSQSRILRDPNYSSDSRASQEFEPPPFNPYDEYSWFDKINPPLDDYDYAKLPLTLKIDTCISIFENSTVYSNIDPATAISRKQKKDAADAVLGNNPKDFDNFENVFLPQIQNKNDHTNDLTIRMLREFKHFLIEKYPTIEGKILRNGQERREIQKFINLQIELEKLTKS